MDKATRIFILSVVFLATFIIILCHKVEMYSLGNPGIVIISAIVMMALSILMLEHYFTRPTDVVATTTSVLLLLAPVSQDMKSLGVWYWVIICYTGLMLILSLASLILLDPNAGPESKVNRLSLFLKNIVTSFANAKFLWFIVFSAALFGYVSSNSSLFIYLVLVAAFLLVIDPKKIAIKFFDKKIKKNPLVARVIGVQSGSVVLAKIESYATMPKKFDFVQVNTDISKRLGVISLVVEAYTLDEERWIKTISGPLIDEMANSSLNTEVPPSCVSSLVSSEKTEMFKLFVGVVREGTNINRIKFDYMDSASIFEGSLLVVQISEHKVFYQVTDGLATVEILESKNEAGLIVGEAVQLGTWNAERQVFEKFGWLPNINSPVFLASTDQEYLVSDGEVKIGVLPGTGYPISVDIEAAISHHTAILGVTGSGKSVFAREFIREAIKSGRKAICVDFTGEYNSKLLGKAIVPVIDDAQAVQIIKRLDFISAQMDEFANKRDKANMLLAESQIETVFREAFDVFLKGDESATIFSLPDVTNSSVLLDYTKWFFKVLFKVAKENRCHGKKVCVVLEEAHTVIPEWNFLGIEDKRASALVNSIGQIALQGRKYGVGIIVIAQRTANVSKTVLTQCNTIIAFQQFDKTSADFLSNYMGEMAKVLPRLRPRSAVVVGKAFRGGMPIIFEVPNINESE